MVRFEVIDSGVGMTPEQLGKIFQPFEQVGDMQKRAEGTGLGLTISQQLVSLMGGELRVKSEYGHGSTFWFEITLPITNAEIKETKPLRTDIVGYKGEKRTILVADDKLENRLVLLDLLGPLGFNMVAVNDGKELVAKAQEIQPHFIMTDLIMPIMTGFEAVQAIRQVTELKDVPVVAVSASVLGTDQVKSRVAGCDAFLSKPIEFVKIIPLLESFLHLEWEYESPSGDISAAMLAIQQEAVIVPPPQVELETLYELAMMGMLPDIDERLTKLEKDAQYIPFVQKLRGFVTSLEDEALVKFIEGYLQK